MGTRASYVFKEDARYPEGHVIFKHNDGYPSGAVKFIAKARDATWASDRFEADDFAAAFVEVNRNGGRGQIRLCGRGDWEKISPSDIEYVYIISPGWVEAMSADGARLFRHPLSDIERAA